LFGPHVGEKDLVIITGNSGFIGSALVNKLAGCYRLVGLDRATATISAAPW
jgi:nucleoside-diphosphate-sugar epimerase